MSPFPLPCSTIGQARSRWVDRFVGRSLSRVLVVGALLAPAAQGAPQLPTAPEPAENPWTREKARLGKILFWEEQLSSTHTVACATCHRPSSGFADPRTILDPEASRYFGTDRTHHTGDDVLGSRAMPLLGPDGTFRQRADVGFGVMRTRRNAPTVLNAAYAPALFWDGRASGEFRDPVTGEVISASGAALEAQVLEPLLSHFEMSAPGRIIEDLAAHLRVITPLAEASHLPAPIALWTAGRGYPELFGEAFGDDSIQPRHIAQALATYIRTLVTRDLPVDRYLAGDITALSDQERRGFDLFEGAAGCADCHGAPHFTDFGFHNLGVDPVFDDGGRREVTGLLADRGKFKTPSLRGVELTAPYFHDGSAMSLEDVVAFYDQGGLHDAPNKAAEMVPLGLTPQEQADLVAFMKRPLTDPRVEAAVSPFDGPRLFSESRRVPARFGQGTPGSGGHEPTIHLVEGLQEGQAVTVGIQGALGGALGILYVGQGQGPIDSAVGGTILYFRPGPGTHRTPMALEGSGEGAGHATLRFDMASMPSAIVGSRLIFQWIVDDPTPGRRFAATRAISAVVY